MPHRRATHTVQRTLSFLTSVIHTAWCTLSLSRLCTDTAQCSQPLSLTGQYTYPFPYLHTHCPAHPPPPLAHIHIVQHTTHPLTYSHTLPSNPHLFQQLHTHCPACAHPPLAHMHTHCSVQPTSSHTCTHTAQYILLSTPAHSHCPAHTGSHSDKLLRSLMCTHTLLYLHRHTTHTPASVPPQWGLLQRLLGSRMGSRVAVDVILGGTQMATLPRELSETYCTGSGEWQAAWGPCWLLAPSCCLHPLPALAQTGWTWLPWSPQLWATIPAWGDTAGSPGCPCPDVWCP